MLNSSRPATRAALCRTRLLGGALSVLLLPALARAGVPTEPAKRNALIGQPTALLVEPPSMTLTGPRATQQLVVTGRYADGSVRDLTAVCDFAAEGARVVVLAKGGFVMPAKNGSGAVAVKA